MLNVRATLNENPRVAAGAVGSVILIGLICIATVLFGTPGPKLPTKSYYAVDDGATTFTDDIGKLTPFDKDGKEAVRAQMFRCGKNKPFIAYLERFTPEARTRLDEIRAQKTPMGNEMLDPVVRKGIQIKKPGDKDWVTYADPSAPGILMPTCPDPATENLEPCFPP